MNLQGHSPRSLEEGSAEPPLLYKLEKGGRFLICWKIVIRNRKMYNVCDVSEVTREKQRKLAWVRPHKLARCDLSSYRTAGNVVSLPPWPSPGKNSFQLQKRTPWKSEPLRELHQACLPPPSSAPLSPGQAGPSTAALSRSMGCTKLFNDREGWEMKWLMIQPLQEGV